MKNLPNVKIEFYQLQYGMFTTVFFLKDLVCILKNHFIYHFKILTYISGIDYPENVNRFKLIYDFLSIKYNNRIKLKILVNETLPIKSIAFTFPGALWWENEIWDMFGVVFSRQKIMVRLLTDYGFLGYPLRKDFPLSGFVESKYNLFNDKISYTKLELAQSYRAFKQNSPWEKN